MGRRSQRRDEIVTTFREKPLQAEYWRMRDVFRDLQSHEDTHCNKFKRRLEGEVVQKRVDMICSARERLRDAETYGRSDRSILLEAQPAGNLTLPLHKRRSCSNNEQWLHTTKKGNVDAVDGTVLC